MFVNILPSRAAIKKMVVGTVAAVALAGTVLATAEPAQAFRGGFGGFRGGGIYRPFGGGFGRFGYGRFGYGGGFGYRRFGYSGFGYRRFGWGGYGFRRFGYGFGPGIGFGLGYGLASASYGYGYPYGGYGAPYGAGVAAGNGYADGYQQTAYNGYRRGIYSCGPYERRTHLERKYCR